MRKINVSARKGVEVKKILIVDDHPLIRNGLRNLISYEPDLEIACESSTGEQTLKLVEEYELDLVILDISLPDINGFEILSRLRNLFPNLPVLMMSVMSEDIYASKALKAGASGFINKEAAPEELIIAIRKLISGGHYLSPVFTEKIALDFQGKLRKPLHECLSSREFLVLTLISSGKALAEIAADLSLSIKTVSTYRSRILEKMEFKNNASLVKYCINEGLI